MTRKHCNFISPRDFILHIDKHGGLIWFECQSYMTLFNYCEEDVESLVECLIQLMTDANPADRIAEWDGNYFTDKSLHFADFVEEIEADHCREYHLIDLLRDLANDREQGDLMYSAVLAELAERSMDFVAR